MSIRKYWSITESDVYVRVFDEILSEVDHSIFDKDLIQGFRSLSPECRYLLTRTYLRAPRWIRREQYEKYMAPENVLKVTEKLVETNWLQSTPPLENLMLDVASQTELQEIAKDLGIKNAGAMTRPKLAEQLIQMQKQQAFFSSGRVSTKIAEALKEVKCFFMPPQRRRFFFDLEQMFLFPVGLDATLEVMFLAHMKKHSFRKYEYRTQVEAPLFKTTEEFAAYARARELCKPIEDALQLAQQKISDYWVSSEHLDLIELGFKSAAERNFLQAGRCYGRAIFNTSQILMKLHKFIDEYAWLQKYLDQTVHRSKRGVALIRKLVLELRFLDETRTNGASSWLVSALNTYYDAVAEVSDIEMLDLQRKTVKLLSSIRNAGLHSALPIVLANVQNTKPKINIPVFEVIAAPVKPAPGEAPAGPGTRLVYGEGVGVEQLALLHYEGYSGGHYENSMMLTIFWLLFHDLLFSNPDQFRCAYQSHPMNVQQAIDDNEDAITARLEAPKLLERVLENREKLIAEYGDPKPYVGALNWLISDKSLSGVIIGLGKEKLRIIMQRIKSNYRKYASGFPDLTIWHPEQKRTKFVEVKSENDTVSDNQLLWMQFMLEHGIDVEICKVVPQKRTTKRKR